MKLGAREPAPEGTIPVPGGRLGTLLVGIVGFVTTAVAIVFALMPPGGSNPWVFEAKILSGCALLLGFGWLLYRAGKRAERPYKDDSRPSAGPARSDARLGRGV